MFFGYQKLTIYDNTRKLSKKRPKCILDNSGNSIRKLTAILINSVFTACRVVQEFPCILHKVNSLPLTRKSIGGSTASWHPENVSIFDRPKFPASV